MNKREKRVSFAELENRAESGSTGTLMRALYPPTSFSIRVREQGDQR